MSEPVKDEPHTVDGLRPTLAEDRAFIGRLLADIERLRQLSREHVRAWFDSLPEGDVRKTLGDLNGELEAENERLRAEVERLSAIQAADEAIARDNHRLGDERDTLRARLDVLMALGRAVAFDQPGVSSKTREEANRWSAFYAALSEPHEPTPRARLDVFIRELAHRWAYDPDDPTNERDFIELAQALARESAPDGALFVVERESP